MKEKEIGGEIKCEREGGKEGGREVVGDRKGEREGVTCITYKCIWVHMYM